MIISPIADKKTLVQRIVLNVRDNLLRGALQPGDRLPPESRLAERFGVGRTSVREAIKALSAIGVLEIRRGEGTFIATGDSFRLLNPLEFALILEQREARELLELRRIIDLGCCDLVVQRATNEDISALTHITEEHQRLVESGAGSDKIGTMDIQFHQAFLTATHNRPLIIVGRTVWALFTSSIVRMVADRAFAKMGVEHHSEIIRAIHSRDARKLREIVEVHLSAWYDRIASSDSAAVSSQPATPFQAQAVGGDARNRKVVA